MPIKSNEISCSVKFSTQTHTDDTDWDEITNEEEVRANDATMKHSTYLLIVF